MYFYYPFNVLAYNAANGINPFTSISHSRAPKGVSAASFRFFTSQTSDSNTISANDNTLVFNNIINSVSAVQKNLASVKRQLKALSIYSPEEIRANSALRLKAAQLELTLKHLFEESTIAFSKEELEKILEMLETVK